MNEVNFSMYDRNLLDEIKYHLETIATNFERGKSDYYELGSGALINLKSVQALTKCRTNPHIFFYMGGYNEGEMTYTKAFETVEARDAEYERLKEKLMKK